MNINKNLLFTEIYSYGDTFVQHLSMYLIAQVF